MQAFALRKSRPTGSAPPPASAIGIHVAASHHARPPVISRPRANAVRPRRVEVGDNSEIKPRFAGRKRVDRYLPKAPLPRRIEGRLPRYKIVVAVPVYRVVRNLHLARGFGGYVNGRALG